MYVEELKDEREWEAFLQASPEGTFYHSLKWKEAIQRSFPYSAFYLTIKDKDGMIVGICPGFILSFMHIKIYQSIPHSDYGGPIIARHCIHQASLSLRFFLQKVCPNMDVAYAKFHFTDDNWRQFFFSPLGYVNAPQGVVEIDLKSTPSDFLWHKIFSQNRRRKIRLVEREGFQAQEATTKSDLKDFYRLYCKNMKHLGATPYPYQFIENLWRVLYPENLRIWLVEKHKRIAGILFFKYGQKSYAAYDGLDREQRIHGLINYIRWQEIKKAEEEGLRYVSFGSTPNDPKHPYYIQKMSFGNSFHKQKTVWYPLSSMGCILLQTRAKAVSTWKKIRKLLPTESRRILESKLERL